VLDEGGVPQEADDQDVEQKNNEKHHEGLEAVGWGFAVCEILKHLVSTNIFFRLCARDGLSDASVPNNKITQEYT
jgi:hypothetical protein